MDRSASFRRTLATRVLRITATIALASPFVAACGGDVSVSHTSGGSTGEGSGGGGGAGGGVSTTGGGGQGGSMLPPPQKGCVPFDPADDACPPATEAAPLLPTNACGMPANVVSGPTFENGQCCYEYYAAPDSSCGTGRPFLVGGEARTAARREGPGWTGARGDRPDLRALAPDERAALARAWERDALAEHASIASFGRFALELMAVGAPAELLDEAHRAARDEVRHAELCFALASAYGGAPVAPSRFPFGGRVEVTADLAELAARVALEGCVGETLAALLAAEQLARAADPAVRDALATIAEDEARHAELAWRTVAWAISVGGERVRREVARAFASAPDAIAGFTAGAPETDALEPHGRVSAAAIRATLLRGLDEIVRPAAAELCASLAPEPRTHAG